MSLNDELIEAKDHFFIGAFSKALELLEALPPSNDIGEAEKEALQARCYLSLGSLDKIKGMQHSQNPALRGVALMAVFLRTQNESQKKTALDRLKDLYESTKDPSVAYLMVAAMAYSGEMVEAAEVAKQVGTPELLALRVQVMLLMNRPDLASKALRVLQGKDDSSAVKIVSGMTAMAEGEYEDCYLNYCDLGTQFLGDSDDPSSLALSMGKAVANMQRGMYEEAMEEIQRLLKFESEQPTGRPSAESLVNAMACSAHLSTSSASKGDVEKHLASLKQLYPSHPLSVKAGQLDDAFKSFGS